MFNLLRAFCRPAFSQAVLYAAAGSLFALIVTVWFSLCGTSSASITALAISFVAGSAALEWARSVIAVPDAENSPVQQNRAIRRSWRISLFMGQLALAWLTPLLMNVTLLAGCETFGTSGSVSNLFVMMFPGLIVVANVVLCGLFLRTCYPQPSRSSFIQCLSVMIGCLFLIPLGWFSIPMAATVTMLFLIGAVLCELQTYDIRVQHKTLEEAGRSVRSQWPSLMMASASTILVISTLGMMNRLIQLNIPIMFIAGFWTTLFAGSLVRLTERKIISFGTVRLLSFVVLALFPVMFNLLAEWNLAITSGSGVVMTVVLRSLQIAVVCAAGIVPLLVDGRTTVVHVFRSRNLLTVLAMLVICFAVIGRGVSEAILLSVGLLIHVAGALLQHRMSGREGNQLGSLTGSRVAWIASALFAIVPMFKGEGDSSRVSSLLFSPRTLAAIERGVAKDLIEHSDANRLVERIPSEGGQLSVWRRAGYVYEFQKEGVALGRVSADTSITPQPAEEILPAIMGLISHPRPGRVLLIGDDTGVCLRTTTHFPVQEIVALRGSEILTSLAKKYTWSHQDIPTDEDTRVRLMYLPPMLALRDRSLKSFDVIVAAMPQFSGTSNAFQYTTEFYQSVRSRLTTSGVFCQRLKQSDIGPRPVQQVMSSMMDEFEHVGVIQAVPGELILMATNSSNGLVDPQIMSRLQREHVKQQIATTGWDWSQVAVLPLINANDPIGMFSHEERPRAISIRNGGFSLSHPLESVRRSDKSVELRLAFGPHQVQLASTIPLNDDVKEAQRRLNSLQQQIEILAGMPDQPWTYRKSLRMEMQRDPRPPIEEVANGQIVKTAHPLDQLRKDYFISLGNALHMASIAAGVELTDSERAELLHGITAMTRFADACEPLMSHFAHYEIIRLHELSGRLSLQDELQHRLHIVFYTTSTDASVRPVISALEQLVEHPELVQDDVERYDLLNSLAQKLIERWEARTAWEPRSALRVQNDVEKSVRVVNLAMDHMEKIAVACQVPDSEFLRRRRYITAALIGPLRDYRDQVLAHRSQSEAANGPTPAEPNTEDPSDLPLLINPGKAEDGIRTN